MHMQWGERYTLQTLAQMTRKLRRVLGRMRHMCAWKRGAKALVNLALSVLSSDVSSDLNTLCHIRTVLVSLPLKKLEPVKTPGNISYMQSLPSHHGTHVAPLKMPQTFWWPPLLVPFSNRNLICEDGLLWADLQLCCIISIFLIDLSVLWEIFIVLGTSLHPFPDWFFSLTLLWICTEYSLSLWCSFNREGFASKTD